MRLRGALHLHLRDFDLLEVGTALEDAFLSIDNSETRRSVVALVTSLAESADPRARRRRTG